MRLFWLGLLAVLWARVSAQPVSPDLQALLQQRENDLRHVRLVWDVDFVRRPTTSVPAQAQQQAERSLYDTLIQQLRARGVPPAQAEAQAKQMASQLASGTLPRAIHFRTEYTVERTDDYIRVVGSIPTGSPSGWEPMTWEIRYHKDTALAVPIEWSYGGRVFSARTVRESDRSGIGRPWVRIWKGTGHAAYHRFYKTPLPITPEMICLGTGLSPLGMYGGRWNGVRRDPSGWTLRQDVSDGEMAPASVELHLSEEHGAAIDRAEWILHRTNIRELYTVQKWTRFKGVWLPALIVDDRTTPVGTERRVWTLKQVTQPTRRPLEIPRDYPVADYRLLTAESGTGPENGDLRVAYTWTGSLPTEDELRRIRAEQLASRTNHQADGGRLYVRLIPPLLLILIGALWYWRLRMKKVV